MKRHLTTLLLTSLVVCHAGVGRAEKNRPQSPFTLQEILGAGEAATLQVAAQRRVSWEKVRVKLESWQRHLQQMRAQGRTDNAKVNIGGQPVGTLGSFERDLTSRIKRVETAIANNEQVFARLSQKTNKEWVMLARAAHDLKTPKKIENQNEAGAKFVYDEVPDYWKGKTSKPRRVVGIVVFKKDGLADHLFEERRKKHLDLQAYVAKRRGKGLTIDLAQASESNYNGVPILTYVEPAFGNISMYALVENFFLISSFDPIQRHFPRLQSKEEIEFYESQAKREFPKVLARIRRLIAEVQGKAASHAGVGMALDSITPGVMEKLRQEQKRKDQKWASARDAALRGINLKPQELEMYRKYLNRHRQEYENDQSKFTLWRYFLVEQYGRRIKGFERPRRR